MSFGIAAVIPTFGEDVVAVYRQSERGDDTQIFEDAHLIQVDVDEHVTFYKHPLENGRSLVDHRIIEPVDITMRVILVDSTSLLRLTTGGELNIQVKDLYDQIRAAFLDGTLLSIQTRANTYRNQLIQGIPHIETAEIFDGIVLTLNMSELQRETDNVRTPVDETQESTVGRGRVNPLEVTASVAASVTGQALLVLGGT